MTASREKPKGGQGQQGGGAPKPDPFSHYAAGVASGAVSTLVGYPLDVARVRLLFGASTKNLFNGVGFTFTYSMFKSGLVWPLQKDFQQFINSKKIFGEGVSTTSIALTGAVGNLIPGMIFNPCNIIKVRYMESPEKHKLREIVRHIIETQGGTAFVRGLLPTLLRDGVWGMAYFPLFHKFQGIFPETTDKTKLFGQDLAASTGAASLATLISSYLDGIRLWQQREERSPTGRHHTFVEGAKKVIMPSRANFLSTFSGVVRVTITTVFGHVTYIQIVKLLEQSKNSPVAVTTTASTTTPVSPLNKNPSDSATTTTPPKPDKKDRDAR